MEVWVVGVPVVDGDPVEPGTEVGFHLLGKVACEGANVRHLASVLGRDDEAEMVAVVLGSLGEGYVIGAVAAGVEHHSFLAVTCDAVALQIRQMCGQWGGAKCLARMP